MFSKSRTPLPRGVVSVCLASLGLGGSLALTGCGVNAGEAAPLAPIPIGNGTVQIHGAVHGGAFPIQFATVRLMETQTNGYGGAAKQLAVTQSDKLGNFNFSNNLTCDPGQYVYMTVSSGQTVSGKVNNNVVQAGVIGSCSVDLVNPQNVNVWLSELSTVAAAYALGNFITISPNDASGAQIVNISAPAANNASSPGCTYPNGTMTCTASGLANGFANAFNLVDSVRYDGSFPTGQANSSFLSSANTQAVVPQALINTLGNILQSCVDSAGGSGSPCVALFQGATPPAGTAPQNTMQTALNMARYPTNNVDTLFKLQAPSVPFTPTLSTDKIGGATGPVMSFALSIFYGGTGLTGDAGMPYPIDVALDAKDNAYVLYGKDAASTAYGAVDGFAPNGFGLFAGAHQTALPNPAGLALDSVGNAWVTNDTATGGIAEFSTTGKTAGTITQTVAVPNGFPAGIALETGNTLWVSRDAADLNASLVRLPSNTSYQPSLLIFSPLLRASVKRIAVDANQNVWGVTSSTTSNAVAFGFPYGANGFFAFLESTNLSAPGGFGVAVTGGFEAYFPLNGQLDSASGNTVGSITANSAGAATVASGAAIPAGTAVDGAGNIFWTDFESGGGVFMVAPTTGTGAVTANTLPGGKIVSFQPCFIVSGQCHATGTGTNLRGMAIDSSGAMWYVADNPDYAVVQTLGLAAPAWPLLSYAHAGSPVQ